MTIDIGIAVTGKMFGGHQHSILRIGMRAFDVRGHIPRHLLRILAKRSDVDHRIRRIVVHIRHRRENPLHAQSPSLARRLEPLKARRLDIARRADRHVVRKPRAVSDAHRRPALEIRADNQRSLRHLLHLIQKQRERVRRGIASQCRIARDC